MRRQTGFIFLILAVSALAMAPIGSTWSALPSVSNGSRQVTGDAPDRSLVDAPPTSPSNGLTVALADDKPDDAPIIERKLDFYDFSFPTIDGHAFNLRDYAKGKSVVIVEYFAGWCKNSNRNGHAVERLWTRYRQRGVGVVGVAEYSDSTELSIHINRIGIDYPVVVESRRQDQRKDSSHYKYRRAVSDKRKWGTPFYVIIDARDIEAGPSNAPLARRVYTVSGELVETEVDEFMRARLAGVEPK